MRQEYTKSQKIMSKDISGYKDNDGKSHPIGWWENEDDHADRPVMDTCLATLQLTIYYRFSLASSVRRSFAVENRETVIGDEEDIIVIFEN